MKVDDTLQKNPQVSHQALEELHMQLYTWALFRCDFDRAAAEDLMQQVYDSDDLGGSICGDIG